MDQTEIGARHAILMLSLRVHERSVPLAWAVEKGEANIGSKTQTMLLERIRPWLPEGARPILMADRFYPSKRLVEWLSEAGFGWRIRLRSDAEPVCSDGRVDRVGDLCRDKRREFYEEHASLWSSQVKTPVGFVWDKGHAEGWAIAMDCRPTRAAVMDYGLRWGIEPMFSDFKSRGFDLQKSQMRLPERLSKLILLIAIAYRVCLAGAGEAAKKNEGEERARNAPA